jgi:hypothetical protein
MGPVRIKLFETINSYLICKPAYRCECVSLCPRNSTAQVVKCHDHPMYACIIEFSLLCSYVLEYKN